MERSNDLRLIAWKIRGLAYLMANQKADGIPPSDLDEINWGIGQILEELGSAVTAIAENAEKAPIAK